MNTNSSAIIVPPPSSVTSNATEEIIEIPDDVVDVTVPHPFPWVWLAIVVVLLAAAGGYWWWRKRQVQVAPARVIPPHVRAKHKLAGAFALLHDPRLFCTLVSDTLRVYLEERFDFHAPERTTEEFLIELQTTSILNGDQKERLAEFLERCDLVKFARFEPHESELRELLEAALRLIDETQYELGPAPGEAKVAIRPGEVAGVGARNE